MRVDAIAGDKADLLATWGLAHSAVAAIWLFGSRARGDHRPDSDFEIALELMPKRRSDDDWAYTAYFFSCDRWKEQIASILECKISLVCFREDLPCKFDPRVLKIWLRSS